MALRFHRHEGRYTDVPPGEPDYSESAAGVRLSHGRRRIEVSIAEVAADVSLWVDVWRFPGVMSVSLSRSPDQQSDDSRHRSLWAIVAGHAAAVALQQRFP